MVVFWSGVVAALVYWLLMLVMNFIGHCKWMQLFYELMEAEDSEAVLAWLRITVTRLERGNSRGLQLLLPFWPIEWYNYWRDKEEARRLGLV